MEKNIFLIIIEHGLKFPKGFKYTDFVNELNIVGWERKIVDEYFNAAYTNARSLRQSLTASSIDTPFLQIENGNSGYFGDGSHTYIISYDANFKYIDYQELKFARETAKEAQRFSKLAIGISILAFLASILMPIYIAKYFTQTIKLEDSQIKIIQDYIK